MTHAAADDPHADLHALAEGEHEDHEPALGGGAGADEDWHEALNKLDKRLTGRINDLRKDFDSTKKAISTSVQKLSNDLGTLKTSVENNTASIESLSNSVETATTKADAAKKAADQAAQDVHAVKGDVTALQDGLTKFRSDVEAKAAELEQSIGEVGENVDDLRSAYEGHTHDVRISLNGETDPPKAAEAPKHEEQK